jgi:ATP-dependent RNA/DNA helicase IGHMBP2
MPEHPHLQQLHLALASAGAWEREELERLGSLPLPDRIAAGVSWPPLQVEDLWWAGRDHTAVVLRLARGVDLHEGIGMGDRVEVACGDRRAEGVVREASRRWAEVRVRGDFPGSGEASVTRLFDPEPWRRLADALARADGHRSALRDVLLGDRPPSPPLAHGASPPDPRLNESQQRAAHAAVSAGEVALIHGPPGTGKTRLLAAIVAQLVSDGDRPWALADSNAAVDHLAARIADRGVDVVRVGSYGRMNDRGRALSLRHRIESGPYGHAILALDRDLTRLQRRDDAESRVEGRKLFIELRELRVAAQQQALESAQVIASTFGTLAWMAPELPDAHTAVVDEATQAIEAAVWTAVPRVQRIILCGDPHQLGPVVRQPNSRLSVSLVERLLRDQLKLPMPMLEVQHRMHRDIQRLVEPVYGATYTPHPDVDSHVLADLPGVASTALTSSPTLWIDTAGAGFDEQQDPLSRSFFNPGEAKVVAMLVAQLIEAGLPRQSISVIAPYSAQVKILREDPALADIEIDTINAFQGREQEAIVVTWVRSGDEGALGFVDDDRRLTVALTRARRFLACVGDTATLCAHPRFASVVDQFATRDALSSIWEEPWSELT